MINEYQDFALNNFLYCWQESLDYHNIIEALRHDSVDCNENCKLCAINKETRSRELFDHLTLSSLSDHIESMVKLLMSSFIPKTGLWEVQTCFTYGWENCWKDDNEIPTYFATEKEAQDYLAEYIADMQEAVRNGDISDFDPDDYRIVKL